MPSRRTFRGRPGKTIDFKQWTSIPSIRFDQAAAATISGASVAFSSPFTILRIRGGIVNVVDTATDGDDITIGYGLAILSTDAFALGATAFPDPLGEPEYPWLWWYASSLISTLLNSANGVVSDVAAAERIVVDSKAMRKVKPGESLVWVVQTGSATPVDILMENTRVLVGS